MTQVCWCTWHSHHKETAPHTHPDLHKLIKCVENIRPISVTPHKAGRVVNVKVRNSQKPFKRRPQDLEHEAQRHEAPEC